MLVTTQQVTPSIRTLYVSGLPRLLQQQLATDSMLQPHGCNFHAGTAACMEQEQQQQAQKRHQRPGTSRISSSHPRPRGFPAYRARLPKARKYGPELRDRDPKAFEQMRLIVGYYDLPENRNKPKPPPPTHVMINNLQTLKFTKDVDPYYKLALLSYRSKLANIEILKGLEKSQAFLQKLAATDIQPDFVPSIEGLTAASPQQKQQQEHTQQQQEQAEQPPAHQER